MKLVRDGLEYLKLLADAGHGEPARAWAWPSAPHAAEREHDPARLYALRRRLGDAIVVATAGQAPRTAVARRDGTTRCP